MTAATSDDFRRHLRKQLSFLERSCASYDAGYTDEAIRIATIIRVLIHDTAHSTSLLRHLGAIGITLLSTCPDKDDQFADLSSYQACSFRGLGIMKVMPGKGAELVPGLGEKDYQTMVGVQKWWNQIVWVLDRQTKLTRKSIVLTAANKDGGAHVDLALTREYELLSFDGAAGVYSGKADGVEFQGEIQSAHLISLRQMGYELLHSPDLVALAAAEPVAAPDRGGITVFQGSTSHQPPRQVNGIVRRRA